MSPKSHESQQDQWEQVGVQSQLDNLRHKTTDRDLPPLPPRWDLSNDIHIVPQGDSIILLIQKTLRNFLSFPGLGSFILTCQPFNYLHSTHHTPWCVYFASSGFSFPHRAEAPQSRSVCLSCPLLTVSDKRLPNDWSMSNMWLSVLIAMSIRHLL